MDNKEYYRKLYLRYSQNHLRMRKREVKRRIAELEEAISKYKPKKYKGMLREGYMREWFLENCRKLEQYKSELEVLEELIKPKIVNLKVCVAMFSVCFILYNGIKAEMKNPDKANETPTSMHGTEEELSDLTFSKNDSTLSNIFNELSEAMEEHVEKYGTFVNPTEATGPTR